MNILAPIGGRGEGWGRLWAPRQQLAELMMKRWFETIVPFAALLAVVAIFSILIPNYLSVDSMLLLGREFAGFGLVALAMAIVLIGGGIDISVGSTFALANFATLFLHLVLEWPLGGVIPAVVLLGAFLGAVNGVLIGFLRARALLTTMATLIIFRATYDLLIFNYATDIATGYSDSDFWYFLGEGFVAGLPVNLVVLLGIALLGHLVLSRSRIGWHVTAVGAGRLAARHAGLPVRSLVCGTYITSGMLAALAGMFYAARIVSPSRDAGLGMEMEALTAVVLGGVSLLGGKGSMGRALIGALTVLLLTNGLVRYGVEAGVNFLLLGVLLLIAVGIDVKWLKNLHRAIARFYTDPAPVALKAPAAGSVAALNHDLRGAYFIGFRGQDFLGQEDYILDDRELRLAAPEDVAIDAEGRVYTGTAGGLVIRYSGPHFSDREVFANIGGQVRGLAFRGADLYCCVAGLGLYRVRPDGSHDLLTNRTGTTLLRLRDDSRLILPCDLDIGPDGLVVFSESSVRYDIGSWITEAIECRPNGRLLAYDPASGRTRALLNRLVFPSGVCFDADGRSVLFAETWLARISRLWLSGPRAGQVETFADDLPGFPANINADPEGGYWIGILALRTPVHELALRHPGLRYRMVRRLPGDEWLVPNFNCGGALHLDAAGAITRALWDPPGRGQNYPAITSARRHGAYLYLGGILNNRIGRITLDPSQAEWQSPNVPSVPPVDIAAPEPAGAAE
ncbi:ABC transporter permease [Marinibaculum pumilum]|uniref:ABC transporter permease n=1 Tax=Marinibaculum pumilum TaxID=1766165 RepID=A0ABV7KYQ6_9PROT